MQQRIELINGKFVVKGKEEKKELPEERPVAKQYSEEVMLLKERVINGNRKLFDAWMQIRDVKDKDEKERQLDRWNDAQNKLHYLTLELRARGYEDCLYIVNNVKTKNCFRNPDGFWCQVCPSRIEYWAEDARNLSNKGGEDEQGGVSGTL